jgi:putative NADH-flavin reductase
VKIAVFGSTGGTGREIVGQALERGHDVTAFARRPMKLSLLMDYITVIRGDVFDPDRVERAIEGQDAVLSALGTDLLHRDEPVASEGTRNIIDAMQKHGVRRLIVESAFGVGESREQMAATLRRVMRLALGPILPDKEKQEELVRQSGLEWVIARPVTLSRGEGTGVYRFGPDLEPKMTARISRGDVAHFMLNQLEHDRNLGKAVTIAY